jgi:hypothetical protein
MKNHLLTLALSLIIVNFSSCRNREEQISLKLEPFPLTVPEGNSLMAGWEKKPVIETKVIDDMENGAGWTVTGIGEMSYTHDRSKDGNQSLRFSTSLRDEEHYRQNRTAWGSFGGSQGGNASVLKKFDTPQDWSGFNRISFWVYVHPTSMPTYCLHLNIINQGTIYNATLPRKDHFIQDLKPGEWNHVMFEIPQLQRDKITEFEINQMLTGHMPEDEGVVTYDIDKLELQRVEADQFEGWSVAKGKFALSQVGYRPEDSKIAMVGEGADMDFQIIDKDNKIVYSGGVTGVENGNGKFNTIDFSDFQGTGVFRIRCGDMESKPFPITEDIWLRPLFSALNFFYCERCGFNVPGIHRECHNDWQGFRGDEKKIINGGWHDAGDLSQGSWRTSMAVFAMMTNLENLQKRKDLSELAVLLRSEIEWGLEWMLKTRFGDGYHMSFSVMRIYTDNKVGTIDDVVSPASNVPWENFLTAAVQCKAALMLEKSNPDLAARCRIAAIEDWEAATISNSDWKEADYREASWGASSSILLGKMTGDNKYFEYAAKFGNLITRCQEQTFRDSIPVTGYFYENTAREKVIHNYHAAFEEAPLIALSLLCTTLPENENWMNWYSAAVLHSEYFMKRGSQIASPYNLLPNSVWKKSEILEIKEKSVQEDMLRQFSDGTPLKKDYVLRTFPIYHDNLFHGNTNIQMSDTWALAEASRLRSDSAGMQLVVKQLNWIFGTNPFGQSLMYGVGYDFAPHFAYCLKDVVGSLPVGMDCMSGDMPHWSATNTATSKEIWVEPVNRFMGAVAVYSSASFDKKVQVRAAGNPQITTETLQKPDGDIILTVTVKGSGKHTISIRTFNASAGIDRKEIDLAVGKTEKFSLELKIPEKLKPYVAVISADNNPDLNREITGSCIESAL